MMLDLPACWPRQDRQPPKLDRLLFTDGLEAGDGQSNDCCPPDSACRTSTELGWTSLPSYAQDATTGTGYTI